MKIMLPKRKPGRQSADAQSRYERHLAAFCAGILQLRSTLDFEVFSRGWCYILEQHGLRKGDLDSAQRLINDCRKSGRLPLNICAEDEAREFENVEYIDDEDLEDYAHKPTSMFVSPSGSVHRLFKHPGRGSRTRRRSSRPAVRQRLTPAEWETVDRMRKRAAALRRGGRELTTAIGDA
jgi:hypothetical protein